MFEGLGPMKAVRRVCIAGYIIDSARACEAFPDLTTAVLVSVPDGYGASTVGEIAKGWKNLRSLVISISCSEQMEALAMCEHLPCLEDLNTDGRRIVTRKVDIWDVDEFVRPVDALKVSFQLLVCHGC